MLDRLTIGYDCSIKNSFVLDFACGLVRLFYDAINSWARRTFLFLPQLFENLIQAADLLVRFLKMILQAGDGVPIRRALSPPPSQDTLCIALELFSLSAPAPKSLDAVLERAQDIMFASPTRRTIRWLEREHQLSSRDLVPHPNVTLLHAIYHPPSHELSLKTLDFSSRSVADRWAAGRQDVGTALDALAVTPAHVGFRYIPAAYRHDMGNR